MPPMATTGGLRAPSVTAVAQGGEAAVLPVAVLGTAKPPAAQMGPEAAYAGGEAQIRSPAAIRRWVSRDHSHEARRNAWMEFYLTHCRFSSTGEVQVKTYSDT
jgi:hypothetical protein